MLWLKRFWPLLLGLIYLAIPLDAVPDALLGLGWTDDLILLLLAYWITKRTLSGRYRQTGGNGYHRARQDEPGVAADTEKNPYEILGVSKNATKEEIRSAYRKQARRYHPDRVSHLGEEFQQLAKAKFQEIQEAYEVLSNEAG